MRTKARDQALKGLADKASAERYMIFTALQAIAEIYEGETMPEDVRRGFDALTAEMETKTAIVAGCEHAAWDNALAKQGATR